jgi:hypothetical protein
MPSELPQMVGKSSTEDANPLVPGERQTVSLWHRPTLSDERQGTHCLACAIGVPNYSHQ